MQSDNLVPASEIEQETGLGKELLRKWRQRYGFPPLETGANGKVGYSRESIQLLLLIKRLLEGGFRPAQIVGRPPLEIERLSRAIDADPRDTSLTESTRRLLERLKKTDISGLVSLMAKERAKGTLSDFVLNTVVPLISGVGEAWSTKEIEVYHEHLCTCVIQRLLQAEILFCPPRRGFPKIIFATPPQELHALGLLMAEAVLADHGATTICLGSHTPFSDIKMAAISCNADVVALSFSFSFPARNVRPTLKHLRHLLPANVELWAGGSGVSSVRRPPNGIRVFSNIQDAVPMMLNLVKRRRS